VDEALEARMEDVRRIVRLGRAGRNRANVKTRQPIARVRIVPPVGGAALGDLEGVVLDELNVKGAEYGAPGESPAGLRAKAKFDVLGPRFGQGMKAAAAAIQSLGSARVAELERAGTIEIDVQGGKHPIHRDEVSIDHDDPEGWVMEREGGWSVALDLAIDDDLRREGFARELVNKIQFMRRKAGFAITDRIEVWVDGTQPLADAIERCGALIRSETQADRLEMGSAEGDAREEWNINGERAVLTVRRK
jgi:isoleucyl-tRNA synthetase